MYSTKLINISNWLTLTRLVVSPLILPFFLVYLLPFNNFYLNFFLSFLFVLLSLTDFFDGYLARKLDQETSFGKMLDPIADKFLVYATLVSLLAVQKIYFYYVIIFIGRELFVMGLRSIALEHSLSVPVSMIGKIKTCVHMILLAILIANPYQALGLSGAPTWNVLELLFLVASVILTFASAWLYYTSFIVAFKQKYNVSFTDEIYKHE